MLKFKAFCIAKNTRNHQEYSKLIEDLEVIIWKPSFFNPCPTQVPFSLVWVLYSVIFFFNRKYMGFMVFNKNHELIHHTFIIPYHFRFNFMSKNDIQISNVWTKDVYRNMDIATIIIKQICFFNKDKSIWYVCREDNKPSIKVANKLNFVYKFNCERFVKFGIPIYRR